MCIRDRCETVCENCVDVCPNRANIAVRVPGLDQEQIVHVDKMCNECGNCAVFCPYASAPYKDKFTLFALSLIHIYALFNVPAGKVYF